MIHLNVPLDQSGQAFNMCLVTIVIAASFTGSGEKNNRIIRETNRFG
jgi:hypothetical protein